MLNVDNQMRIHLHKYIMYTCHKYSNNVSEFCHRNSAIQDKGCNLVCRKEQYVLKQLILCKIVCFGVVFVFVFHLGQTCFDEMIFL